MFQDREEAGLFLAEKLRQYKDSKDAIVLAVPRGGVVVGKQIAINLNLPLSVVVVRKLSAPHNPELAIGAVAPEGIKVIDINLALRTGGDEEYLDEEIKRKTKEIEERISKFGIRNDELGIRNKKIIILVDDGVATGATTLAAIKYIKHLQLTTNNQQLITILAVPVIAKDTYDKLKSEVEEIVALEIPEYFGAVGEFYREFSQVTDEEVVEVLSNLSNLSNLSDLSNLSNL